VENQEEKWTTRRYKEVRKIWKRKRHILVCLHRL